MRGPLLPGDPRRLGGYRLEGRLGQGGMGTVYLGYGPDGRPVAIKVIKPEYAYEEQFRARFRSEVTRARQVPPFCTAEVLDADADHETPYLVVEYVDGPSLAEIVAQQGPLSSGNLYSVAVGVATVLAAIHGAGPERPSCVVARPRRDDPGEGPRPPAVGGRPSRPAARRRWTGRRGRRGWTGRGGRRGWTGRRGRRRSVGPAGAATRGAGCTALRPEP
ncbi:protein kinase domain-containing protein [Couchioplanes caeruleus]|uniref:protein kinase domain-containing protein n=1 Tax=Couchioplanes caeruleus TaxID=56438 RepID=UPI000A73D6F9|nr:protein kinase [Couchioplanes caeruleus]